MVISKQALESALVPGGRFIFNRNDIRDDNETIIKGQWDAVTHDRYRMAATGITGTTISMSGVNEDNRSANTVNVVFEDGCATMGSVTKPGLIYSDSFSGCVFYLYKEPLGHLIGVHANRSSGRLADPDSWMTKRGGKKILTWDSKGKIAQGFFGAVFAFVQSSSVDFYAIEHKDGVIKRVVENKTLAF